MRFGRPLAENDTPAFQLGQEKTLEKCFEQLGEPRRPGCPHHLDEARPIGTPAASLLRLSTPN